MPVVEHEEFGTLDYLEEEVYLFESGLPGFDEATRFLVHEPPWLTPLVVLLCLDQPGLRFYAVPLRAVAPDLKITLSETEREQLELGPDDQPALGLALVTWLEEEPPSANLLAPILLHPPTRRGVQSIQFGSGYNCRHRLGE